MLFGHHSVDHPFSLTVTGCFLTLPLLKTEVFASDLICYYGSKLGIFRSLKFHQEKRQIVVLLSEFHGRHAIKNRN